MTHSFAHSGRKASVSNRASIDIWRSSGTTAKDEGERFSKSVLQRNSVYSQKTLKSIKTKQGDEGFVVVLEANFKEAQATLSNYFFHVGTKGRIRVSVMTKSKDSVLHTELEKLILETLRF